MRPPLHSIVSGGGSSDPTASSEDAVGGKPGSGDDVDPCGLSLGFSFVFVLFFVRLTEFGNAAACFVSIIWLQLLCIVEGVLSIICLSTVYLCQYRLTCMK